MRIQGMILAMLALAGCASVAPEAQRAQVTGEALYRERIAAPPGARLEVVLEDISRADAPAVRLGELVREDAGQPPYAFSIDYNPADIDPRHSYRVAVRLYDGERLLFVTDQVYPVLTRDAPSSVRLMMKRARSAPEQPFGALPATYAGTLPCADCPGIDMQLNLLENGVFFLRQSYQDRDGGPFDDLGRYLLSSHGDQLSLHGGREAPLRFALTAPDTLTLLDRDGDAIDSELNYSLTRQPTPQPLEPSGLLGGKYRYLADAGRFRECRTGLDLAVATEGDNAALEQAYLETRKTPGDALRVSLEGRITKRMPMEGPDPVWTLVPERFIGIWPELDCPEPIRLADLRNSYWRLTLLEDQGVSRAENQREPHLVFREDGRLTGSDGCNRLSGRYDVDGRRMTLGTIAATRMACPTGMEQAVRLHGVLEQVAHYRIMGRHLELLDQDGKLRLRFEAVALQ
ncbi:YbaY family lipoprotein [Pseudohaliea rubra]|uniref:Lipoprotein n=1 Tax=Pseudohaliea rubra DSM 19751 TaxID=1265313 RepID=A0A095VQ14_9GAMM|nr:YbaY family lipoprotein [Pseudohaliea rubra]KGE03193.1 hypothetical protein HRUBRA_02233 [Pseudohaliea rubra DSM 19751]